MHINNKKKKTHHAAIPPYLFEFTMMFCHSKTNISMCDYISYIAGKSRFKITTEVKKSASYLDLVLEIHTDGFNDK